MSNVFNKIIYDSISDMYNNNVAKLYGGPYNNNCNESMLTQIAKEKIGKYFNDNNVIQNGDTDLTDLKHVFGYDTALQK